jgi:anti-anti-sigma factor
MLRITVIESTASSKTLKLEGRVAGTSVEELRRLCSGLLAGNGHGHLILDLSDVSFIDSEGIELFRDLTKRAAAVTNYSPFLAELLKEVVPCS